MVLTTRTRSWHLPHFLQCLFFWNGRVCYCQHHTSPTRIEYGWTFHIRPHTLRKFQSSYKQQKQLELGKHCQWARLTYGAALAVKLKSNAKAVSAWSQKSSRLWKYMVLRSQRLWIYIIKAFKRENRLLLHDAEKKAHIGHCLNR